AKHRHEAQLRLPFRQTEYHERCRPPSLNRAPESVARHAGSPARRTDQIAERLTWRLIPVPKLNCRLSIY
ncbi:hypothetical protein, partial [Mesorhizobium sp. M2A.F.Ca.ET.017.03.2.1]|uniref:hypothetical protein n=1 Tax=Mesorhizobium sp. M2A.F.Ca.ET.017.03.2.1 TaxID=2496650 RepID=UPI001AECF4A5